MKLAADRLGGRVAVVTGAGAGIGRGIGVLFAKEGAKVVVADVDREMGEETVKMIVEDGGEAVFVEADVSKASDVKKMVDAAVEKYGRLDVLVNNAGIQIPGSVVEASEDEWDRILTVNLKSVFLCSKYAVPEMMKQGGGAIVNMASSLGLAALPRYAAYCASKGGIISLTRSMAVDLAPHIRVNCICPGLVDTPLVRRLTAGVPQEKLLEDLKKRYPIPRMARPEEIAHAALYLASDESSYATGSALVVNGGRTAI